MKYKFFKVALVAISISCSTNDSSIKESTTDTISPVEVKNTSVSLETTENEFVGNSSSTQSETDGIWHFEKAVLVDESDQPDNDKLALVKGKTIEITGKELIVRDVCRSSIVSRKKASLKYWGSENTFKQQQQAFKKIGVQLLDSILVIENSKINEGCDLPFSELLFVDNKVISTMYPYVVSFIKQQTDCFVAKSDFELPFETEGLKQTKAQPHELACQIKELEKFRCGNEAISYYVLSVRESYKYVIFPEQCGDSEFQTLAILKDNRVVDQLLISQVAETEINGKMGLNYTEFTIDKNYAIHLIHSTSTAGYKDRKVTKEEDLIITVDGKFQRR